MKTNAKHQAVKLFFQSFSKHLIKIRDGEASQHEQRAQILLSQLNLFEKAMQDYSGVSIDEHRELDDLLRLFEIENLADFVSWAQQSKTNLLLENIYFLDLDSKWNQILGMKTMPERLVVRQWIINGLLGLLAGDSYICLIYVHGQPRLLLDFGQVATSLGNCIAKYIARQLPFWLPKPMTKPAAPPSVYGLIARNPIFLEMIERLEHAAKTDVTILLEGESGTGKEVLSNFIHEVSPRKGKPMIAVNCAAIPPGLIESELFGHEKGSFTGAVGRQIGRVEEANGGTLFLDEIGEMELSMQAKLLRFLQLKEFHRVGGKQKISVDVRIVAATNRKLKKQVADGLFREDLYYRLSVMPFYVSPLRERIEDIEPLFQFFLEKYAQAFGFPCPEVDQHVYQHLARYDFPGNVRELENLVQNVLVVAQGSVLELKHLPDTLLIDASKAEVKPLRKFDHRTWVLKNVKKIPLRMPKQKVKAKSYKEQSPWLAEIPADNDALKILKDQIQEKAHEQTLDLEARFIKELLERAGGSVQKASLMGKINRTLLYKMMDRSQKHLKQ